MQKLQDKTGSRNKYRQSQNVDRIENQYRKSRDMGCRYSERIFNGFILRFGKPKHILHDQGKEFDNKLFHQLTNQLTKLCGVKQPRNTPYHPQTNGTVGGDLNRSSQSQYPAQFFLRIPASRKFFSRTTFTVLFFKHPQEIISIPEILTFSINVISMGWFKHLLRYIHHCTLTSLLWHIYLVYM